MMKKNKLLIVMITGIFFYSGFQVVVTPWGELPGKTLLVTDRFPLPKEPKATWTTAAIKCHSQAVAKISMDGLNLKWSPDGKMIAAFHNRSVCVFNEQGKVLESIPSPGDVIYTDLEWMPDGEKIITVENPKDKEGNTYYMPSDVYVYDLKRGQRELRLKGTDYNIYDLTISQDGKVIFAGRLAKGDKLKQSYSLYELGIGDSKITPIIKPWEKAYSKVNFMSSGTKVVFQSNIKLWGRLITPSAIGVYDLNTGRTRYVTWEAAYITDMTVVEDGKYLITAEKHGEHSVLYKRSLLGGFKLPFMKPVKLPHLGGRMSSDDYPDWHA